MFISLTFFLIIQQHNLYYQYGIRKKSTVKKVFVNENIVKKILILIIFCNSFIVKNIHGILSLAFTIFNWKAWVKLNYFKNKLFCMQKN